MPLHTRKAGDCRGTEADGGRSATWCALCYADGAFLDPDCTLDEMVVIVDEALRRDRASFIVRWLARCQVPSLARWRRASS